MNPDDKMGTKTQNSWNNQRILDLLQNLFLCKGYMVDALSDDNKISIVVHNEHQSQTISLFHLSRQIQNIDTAQPPKIQEQQVQQAIQLFVEQICRIFEQPETQTTPQHENSLFPMLRRTVDTNGSIWYQDFVQYASPQIQFVQPEQLVWNLAEHHSKHVRFWNVFDFSKQDLSIKNAWNIAKQNLISITKPPENWGDGWFCFHQNDGLDAARLLLLENFVQEEVVFAIPSRDLLAFAPIKYRQEMQIWAQDYFSSYPYPLSDIIGTFSPSK